MMGALSAQLAILPVNEVDAAPFDYESMPQAPVGKREEDGEIVAREPKNGRGGGKVGKREEEDEEDEDDDDYEEDNEEDEDYEEDAHLVARGKGKPSPDHSCTYKKPC